MARLVVALGGNALQGAGDRGRWEEAVRRMRATVGPLAELVRDGHQLVLTHGNGPQVGALLRQNELSEGEVPPQPLFVLGAASEGEIGLLIQQELEAGLARRGIRRMVVTIVSRMEVSASDPAFRHPAKPIGRFYSEAEADRLRRRAGWTLREDPNHRGWRRVVASPTPRRWLESDLVRAWLTARPRSPGIPVVAGGGGVPVVRERGGRYRGVDAVIDKDRSAALIARSLGAAALVIVTDVPAVAVGFGRPEQRWLGSVTDLELSGYARQGEFAEGSMGPKVRAVLDFLRGGRGRAIITDIPSLGEALRGRAGTRVRPARRRPQR
ncbi:MAG: carbamate kinase [Thermoplasmata archaeon]|jgi:carbamate kinase